MTTALTGCTYARWTGPNGESFGLLRFGMDTKIGHVQANVQKGIVEADDYDATARLAATIEKLAEKIP